MTQGVGGSDSLNEVRTTVSVFDGSGNMVRSIDPEGLGSDETPIDDYDPHAVGVSEIPAATYPRVPQ